MHIRGSTTYLSKKRSVKVLAHPAEWLFLMNHWVLWPLWVMILNVKCSVSPWRLHACHLRSKHTVCNGFFFRNKNNAKIQTTPRLPPLFHCTLCFLTAQRPIDIREVSAERWQLGVCTQTTDKTPVWQTQQSPSSFSHIMKAWMWEV